MKVRVVCRPDLAAGFALAGLAVSRADRDQAAAEHVARAASDPDVGVVLVDEDLYRRLPRDLVARLDRQALPILAPVPAPAWDERRTAEAYVMDILRQAIGYRVRPR
ncbi:MAG: V-type ATP synthase subunit F [Vicinamibacterales bacterium]